MLLVDPQADQSWRQKSGKSGVEYRTDGVHANASNENVPASQFSACFFC